MHLGKTNPIRFIVHGNQTKNIPDSYKRYICNALRKKLKLLATPVLIEFRQNVNPYVKERNVRKKTR